MGYIPQKVWDIWGEHYEIYYGIYWLKIVGKSMGYTGLLDILSKTKGYIRKIKGYIQKNKGIY